MIDPEALIAETRELNVRKMRLAAWWTHLGERPKHAGSIDVASWRRQIEEQIEVLEARLRDIVNELLEGMG